MDRTPRHDARHRQGSSVLVRLRWRTGGSVGRTIYAYQGDKSEHARDDNSYLIGMMDTPELAQSAVDGHNALIESGETT